nr:lef-12 [Calliteara abietis nucleopolyhedrovirus]
MSFELNKNLVANVVNIIDKPLFDWRLRRVAKYVRLMRCLVTDLLEIGAITDADAESLCLADDTAAWVCGRVPVANFVTLRLKSAAFDKRAAERSIVTRWRFEQSLEQQLLGRDWRNLTYMNFTFEEVAVKLIVWRSSAHIAYSNPCPQLSYFIDANSILATTTTTFADRRNNINTELISVYTRDCDCFRGGKLLCNSDNNKQTKQYVELVFDLELRDESNTYHRSLIVQEDLIEEPVDEGIVNIVCFCVGNGNKEEKIHIQ